MAPASIGFAGGVIAAIVCAFVALRQSRTDKRLARLKHGLDAEVSPHDRFGHRLDEVEYDPSMHWMLRLGVEHGLASLPWREPRPGAHVARAAHFYLFN